MYSRHRSPGNGYRSNSVGMPAASSPRISPENSMRGPGFYNPDYRNFNRGFGRGQPKLYQPPPPPPRKGDIFMEAGRLAAEYLVSKGLLPPTALPPKWSNASFKKQAGEIQDFRPQEGENTQLPPEGRMSALARLGNAVPDAGSSRRRFPDEYNPTGTRNSMRGWKRMESFRNHGSDWDPENSRSGSWSDKARTSPNKEANDDSIYENHEEQQGGLDFGGGVQNPHPSELAPKSEDAGSSGSYLCKLPSQDDMGSKESVSDTREEIPLETDREITKEPDDVKSVNAEIEEVKDGSKNDETEKNISSHDLSVHKCEMGGFSASKHGTDLLRLCNYAKVPTRTRSSLACRGSKVDLLTTAEGVNTTDFGPPIGSAVSIADSETGDGCLNDELSYQPHALGCLASDENAHAVPSEKDAGESGPAYAVEQDKCMGSLTFPDKALIYGQESSQPMAGVEGCNSMDSLMKERGEKRAIQHMDRGEASKKPREWFPSMVTEAEEYSNLSSYNGKQLTVPEERASPGEVVVMAVDEDNSMDMSLFQKGVCEPSIEYAEEKQLLPSSFKICDLNLIEASDMNENQDHDAILLYPSLSEIRKEAASIDIDLSISNDCNISDQHIMQATDSKEVEVIDLENDSAEEDKGFNNPERKTDSVYPGLESFPNLTESRNDIQDAQDGYGLMISELLGNDIPNCSTVPADINSLHNEIGLHNGEEILSDDDPIYMSLGEIPISMPDI